MTCRDVAKPPYWVEQDGQTIRMDTWESPPSGFIGHLATSGAGTPGAGFWLLCAPGASRVTAVHVRDLDTDPAVSLALGTEDAIVDLGFQDHTVVDRLIAGQSARITQRFGDGTESVFDVPVRTPSAQT